MAKKTSSPIAQPSTDIILKVIQEVKDLSRKDIKKWRDAMTAASDTTDPRWYLLQDMYDYLTPDGHLGAVTEIRTGATLNHPFYVNDKSGVELEEQTKFLQKMWFFEFIEDCLDAVFRKYSIIQLGRDGDNVIYDLIPRRNVCIQNKRVYTEATGSKYIDYSQEPNVIQVRHKSEFGIMNDIIPNLIWKKNLLQADAEFSERYGMPLVTAMTSNKADAPKIEKALKNLGEAATGVFPKGSEIEVHDLANKGNPEKVYLDPAKFHDHQVSKRYVGSTTLVDEGANRSQTEVHSETLHETLAKKDRRFIQFICNDYLFPILQNLGFPFDNTKMVFSFDETESLTLKEEWDITNEALQYFELDQEDLQKKFRLKIKGVKQQPTGGGLAGNFK